MGKGKRRRADIATTEAPIARRHGLDTGGLLGHDSTYNVNVTEQLAVQVDVFVACVDLIASLVADGRMGEYVGNDQLPASRLVQRPMATMTQREWLYRSTAIMATYSGMYLRRIDGRDSDGIARSLEPIAPWRLNTAGARWYLDGSEVEPGDFRWVARMALPTVTREFSSVLRLARSSIAAAWSADAYRSDYWEKGGRPPWYVTSDQKLSNADAEAIQTRIVERRTDSPGKPMVLGQGSKIADMGADLTSEGAGLALARAQASIARYLRVPAWLVNVMSEAGSLTYANSSAAGLDLVRYTLQPSYAGPLADALSDELPGSYLTGRRVVIDLRHLTRGTDLEQAQADAIATGNRPWKRPSEARAERHMPSDPTLDLDPEGSEAPDIERIPAARSSYGLRAPVLGAIAGSGVR